MTDCYHGKPMNPRSYDPFKVIEKLYLERRKSHPGGSAQFDERLTSAMASLGKSYHAGRQPELRNKFDRRAHAIQYVPIGIRAVCLLFEQARKHSLPPEWSILSDDSLHVVSLGAGPGTDLLGILTSLSVPPCGLDFTRVDTYAGWRTCYDAFRKDFAKRVPRMRRLLEGITGSFREVDIVQKEIAGSRCAGNLCIADVVVPNRVLSILELDERRGWDLVREIARIMRNGNLFVIVDVALPRQGFKEMLAMSEGACRLEKPKSKCVVRFRKIEERNFGWDIPKSITRLEGLGPKTKIMRSGRFFGGIIWLRE